MKLRVDRGLDVGDWAEIEVTTLKVVGPRGESSTDLSRSCDEFFERNGKASAFGLEHRSPKSCHRDLGLSVICKRDNRNGGCVGVAVGLALRRQ